MAGNSGTIIGAILFCVVVIVSTVLGVYFSKVTCPGFGNNCEETVTPSPVQVAPSLPEYKQIIQGGNELEIGTRILPMNPQPILPSTCMYSMSMDLYFTGNFTATKCILNSNNARDWATSTTSAPNTRRPQVIFTGPPAVAASPSPAPAPSPAPTVSPAVINRPFVYHNSSTNLYQRSAPVPSSIIIPVNRWFNFAFTVDNSKRTIKIYINGSKVSESVVANDFAWPEPPTEWTWNNANYADQTTSVKVRNAYFFSKVLSEIEMSNIMTSTYMPQPLSMGTSSYEKEDFAAY